MRAAVAWTGVLVRARRLQVEGKRGSEVCMKERYYEVEKTDHQEDKDSWRGIRGESEHAGRP